MAQIKIPFHTVNEYCANLTTPADDILNRLERETHLKTIAPQMLSGAFQGKFLETLSRLISPERILEIGSFTGYSAICLARGLKDGGTMDALEMDPEYGALFHKYVSEAGLKNVITLHNGDAKEILGRLKGPYDLIFIDAGKQEYPAYYEAALPLLSSRGVMLLDNLLWEGKVFGETDDADAVVLRDLGKQIHADSRVECVMLPLRDGVMMVRKKE